METGRAPLKKLAPGKDVVVPMAIEAAQEKGKGKGKAKGESCWWLPALEASVANLNSRSSL